MPSQELYLEKKAGLDVFQVLKTYDTAFAKETFEAMDEAAILHLSKSLSIAEELSPDEIPSSPDQLADLMGRDVRCGQRAWPEQIILRRPALLWVR